MKKFLLVFIVLLAGFLRFYQLHTIPHGLYIDEVSIGNNAYAILTSGKDEHGVPYPLFFEAFGEYKMPVAVYLTSIAMAIFGKTEFAVRFTSAFFGTLTVGILYFLLREVLRLNPFLQTEKIYRNVPSISAVLLAIAPWHIQFSRGGFEANIALFLYLLGVFCMVFFFRSDKQRWFVGSIILLVLAMYTYNAYKIISFVTILVSGFVVIRKKQIRIPSLFFYGFGVFLLFLPIVLFAEGNNRFFDASAFSDSSLSLFSYPMVFLQNYLSYFSFPFLFASGDGFGRHMVPGMGPLFRWELPFLFVGFYSLWRNRGSFLSKTVFFFTLLAPIPASLVLPSPHLLRSELLVIPFSIAIAVGIVFLWRQKKRLIKVLVLCLFIIGIYEGALYLHAYYHHYPMRTALDWGGSFKEMVRGVEKKQGKYDVIIVQSSLGNVASYFMFYAPDVSYQLVDKAWEKPAEFAGKRILYITPSDDQFTGYARGVSRGVVTTIPLQSSHEGKFAVFWEL